MRGPEFLLSCDFDGSRSRSVVGVTGDIDTATVPALREFLSTLVGDVEINCEAVAFLDSAGIGLFIGTHRALIERGYQLTLRSVNARCYKTLSISGVAEFLNVEGSASPAV
jgi:anti-sigma B factor antagonist